MASNNFEDFQTACDDFTKRKHDVAGQIMDAKAQLTGMEQEYDLALLNSDQDAMAAITAKIAAANQALTEKERELRVLEQHGIAANKAVMELAQKVVADARNAMKEEIEQWLQTMEELGAAREAYLAIVAKAGEIYSRAESINNKLAVVRDSTGLNVPWLPQGGMDQVNLHREKGVIYFAPETVTKTFKEGV